MPLVQALSHCCESGTMVVSRPDGNRGLRNGTACHIIGTRARDKVQMNALEVWMTRLYPQVYAAYIPGDHPVIRHVSARCVIPLGAVHEVLIVWPEREMNRAAVVDQ